MHVQFVEKNILSPLNYPAPSPHIISPCLYGSISINSVSLIYLSVHMPFHIVSITVSLK